MWGIGDLGGKRVRIRGLSEEGYRTGHGEWRKRTLGGGGAEEPKFIMGVKGRYQARDGPGNQGIGESGSRVPNTRDRRCRSEMRAGDPGEHLGAGPGPVRTCVGEAKVKDICPGAAAGAGAAAASA